jgi:hypothetical protein
MRRYVGTLVLGAALISPVLISGCAARVYDYQYHDYHRWDGRERGYYIEWERDTHHRDMDYARRDEEEQKEYWQWRNNHYGHDHHDHDHH